MKKNRYVCVWIYNILHSDTRNENYNFFKILNSYGHILYTQVLKRNLPITVQNFKEGIFFYYLCQKCKLFYYLISIYKVCLYT